MKKQLVCLMLGLALCFSVQPVFAQSEDVKALKKEIEVLKKDVQDLKKQMASRPAGGPPEFKEAIINIKGAQMKGDKNAKLALLIFTDYQCPFCGRHARDTEPQIEKEYVETGKMKLVFMDFPLDMHQNAKKAHEAGLCAGDQGKFWEMNHKLFDNPTNDPTHLNPESLPKYAEELGLDMAKFKACLDGGKHADEIKNRITEGSSKAGITGTPAFLLGFIKSDGTVKATKKIVGAGPFTNFKTAIDEQLSQGK